MAAQVRGDTKIFLGKFLTDIMKIDSGIHPAVDKKKGGPGSFPPKINLNGNLIQKKNFCFHGSLPMPMKCGANIFTSST